MYTKEAKGEPYLFAKITIPRASTIELLQDSLEKLILSIRFPKVMRWGNLDISWARPIQWVLALFGNDVIPFSLGSIASNRFSFGHRQLSCVRFDILHPREYEKRLKEHYVLVDPEERIASIERQIRSIERAKNVQILKKNYVQGQVVHLTEWPELTVSDFDPDFLKAPEEVLIQEMV